MQIKEEFVRIGEVAQKLGITTRTIRYYEEVGVMGHPLRESGSRKFSRQDIIRLKFILKLKELGINLKEIQVLSEHYDLNDQDRDHIMPQLLGLLDAHLGKVDAKMTKLASLRSDIVAYRSKVVGILEEESAQNERIAKGW